MSILNSLPKKIGLATEDANGLMSSEDKIAINKINRIEADVANKMNKDEKIKSSQLDTSNNAAKIQLINLSDEVKSAMTGKTPVEQTIPFKSLITDYYADSSVTFKKRTPVGSIAAISSEDFCNFNTIGDTEVVLSIPNNYTVYYGDKFKKVTNTPESITFNKGVVSVITYNGIDGFSAYPELGVREQDFILGVFDGTNVSMFNGRYTVNGSVVVGDGSITGSAIKDFTLDPLKLSIQHGFILSDVTQGPYINVNFKSKFVEVVKAFDISIADQYTVAIKDTQECAILENTIDSKYLYIYYDLGTGKINALWGAANESVLVNNEKLVLIGIVYDESNPLGINHEFISINSVSIKNTSIKYENILSGNIIIDFQNKKITANSVMSFIDSSLIKLNEEDIQNITLTDDIITNITSSGIPYTLAAIRVDFDSEDYRLIFDKTENIKTMGLDIIPLFSIKKYTVSHNKESVTVIKPDGNIVKSNNVISSGYIAAPGNDIAVELTTELIDGNLNLTSITSPGTIIIDPGQNIGYEITTKNTFRNIVENLHGIYSVLFNTETSKVEVIPVEMTIDNKVYISLGFLQELSDSLAYTAIGNITDHITLNANRPSNYSSNNGPDPDKGYDWSNNRLVLPKDIYLLSHTNYSLYCQNMSMNKYIDNDYINYEIALPNEAIVTENSFHVNSPVIGEFDTRIVGKFKGNNNCLFKDTTLHFTNPVNAEAKDLTVLCIGDDTVDMNMPGYIKSYLSGYGFNVTMLGKTKNVNTVNGYGLKNLTDEFGEGHKGWRMTDFMCKTKHKDGSPFFIQNNPFMSNSKFDFSYYMQSNSYDKVDVVVISVGLNDITGYHTASAIEDIETLSIYQIIEQMPNIYKEMITNIHEYDSNIKIIINPTMTKGIDDDFNRKSLMLTEALLYDLKDIQNVFFVPGYLTQPLFSGANTTSTSKYPESSGINDTKLGSPVNSTDINGMAQSNLSFMITSAIISVTK